MLITAERLREIIRYDPVTGVFTWTDKATHGRRAGTRAERKRKSCAYLLIETDGKRYRAHRLAWLYMTGAWPKNLTDHKDCDPINNRWNNLREATPSQNSANARAWEKKALAKGVCRRKDGKFVAQVKKDRKAYWLGVFSTPEEAHAAYNAAAAALHGQFSRGA